MKKTVYFFGLTIILQLSTLIVNAQVGSRLTPTDGEAGKEFGYSVSIDGDFSVIGAYFDSFSGATRVGSAYIFKREGTKWTQYSKLQASDGREDDLFGCSVSINGNYVVIGARNEDEAGSNAGAAYVFRFNGTSWAQESKLIANDASNGAHFGISVAINGDYIIVGAHQASPTGGAAYIFKRNGASWIQDAKLLPAQLPSGEFGCAVSISDDRVVVGAKLEANTEMKSGAAYVFKRSVSDWIQEAKLLPSDARINEYWGGSVSINGDHIIVGTRAEDQQVGGERAAYIFSRNGSNWNQQTKLTAQGSGASQLFGYAVAIDSDFALSGASLSGSTFVFQRDGINWNPKTNLANGGIAVAINESRAVLGGINSAYVYTLRNALPAIPLNLRASAGIGEVTLTWDSNTEPDHLRYRIYSGTLANPTTAIDSVDGASNTTRTIKNLNIGTTYYFRITAVNTAFEESGFSNEVNVKPIAEFFTEISSSISQVSSSAAAWGDYDNDSDLDILLTGNDGLSRISKVYRNSSSSFIDIGANLIGVEAGSVAWSDYDNDGNLDILLVGGSGSGSPPPVSKIYRNASGVFTDIGAGLIGVRSSTNSFVAWGDYDNDGDLDIILTGYSDPLQMGISRVYRNNSGSFVDTDAKLTGVFDGSVAWGDYDKDGDLDILLAGQAAGNANYVSKIYRNDGETFTDIGALLQGVVHSSVAWGDYDNDGDLDVVLTGARDGIYNSKVFRNENGNFMDIEAPLTGVQLGSVAWGDYDNDGDLDILLAGNITASTNITKVYRNDKKSFNEINANLFGIQNGCATWADYDNDGDLDILSMGQASSGNPFVTKLYRNNCGSTNTAPTAPTGSTSSINGNSVYLSWNESTDKETLQDALTYNLRVGTTPNGSEIVSSMSRSITGYRKIPKLGNVNHNTSWTIKNLKPGKYYWSVQAIDNAFAGSPFATEQTFTIGAPGDTTPPASPRNLIATAGNQQITLQWQANTESDFLRYRIYGGTAPNPTTKIDSVSGAANTSKTITGLTNGTRYYFRLTAVDNSLNESGFSNEASATPSASDVPPAAPQNVRATAGDRQITLNWNANTETDFLRYRIYGGTAPNPTTKIDSTNSLSATTKTVTNLINGTRYYFRLTAVDNSLQESGFSNEVSATPSAIDVPPAAPQNVQASAGIGAVTLTWNANTEPDFLRYRIYSSTNQVTFAKVDSVSGANNTSRTIAGLVNGVTYYFRVTAVDAGALESAPSNIVSARPQADVTAPTLALAASVSNAMINTSVNVLMNASDASGVQSVTLYYRIAGEAAFSNRAMTLQSRYSANIPASAITNRGAEFYAQASDVFGNVATTPRYPVRVICPNGITAPVAQPNGTSASDYRLFSLPLEVDDKTPAGFLAANPSLGSAEAGKYRWYAFERSAGTLREYPNFGSVQITPDAGFALLVNLKNVRLKTGSGVTVATASAYEIALPQGWSLLGNPFNFNVPLDSLRVSAGTFELWRFTGDWEINTAGLEPWQGYAIWMSQAATFSIRAGVAGLNSGASFYEVANNVAENWLIQITAEDGRSASRFNFVGQHEAAHDGHDAWDLHEPLALETGVGLRLHTAQNEEALKADIRAPSAHGHVWNFTCRVASEEEVLRLSFAGAASVPSAFELMLLDNATARAYDLRTQAQIEFAVSGGREKQFTLLAGAAEFVRSRDEVAFEPPNNYVVLENFPNPFNPATQINYILPEERHVSLEIYNLHGQRVATLVNETQTRGAHTMVWRAESFSSGVYFIKLSAGREVEIRKAVLMK